MFRTKLIVAAVAAFLLGQSAALAQSQQELFEEVSRTTQGHLAITYMCQEDLGSSWYYAARTISEGTLQQFGQTSDQAILQVQKWEDRIIELMQQGDPIAPLTGIDRQNFCLDEVNKAQTEAKVAAARLREALGVQ